MNVKASVNRYRGRKSDNLEMTPIMNLFLILVPFLLFTASFVNIAILEISLPQLNKTRSITQQQDRPKEQSILSTLEIRETGFVLNSPTLTFPVIMRRAAEYDYDGLVVQLKQIKQKFPQAQDMVIKPDDVIKYNTVIAVMDRLREIGFPNISISG